MFGGAGPLFGSFILERFDIGKVIIPREPANFSAYGMMMTDVVYDYKQTYVRLLLDSDVEEIEELFQEGERRGLESLEKAGLSEKTARISRSVDVRYLGLTHALNVPVTEVSDLVKPAIANGFSAMYKKIYGYRLDNPVQIVNLNVKVIGVLEKPELTRAEERKVGCQLRAKEERRVYVSEESTTGRVYERSNLRKNDSIEGSAIVEEPSSTIFVAEGQVLNVDEWGNLVITKE